MAWKVAFRNGACLGGDSGGVWEDFCPLFGIGHEFYFGELIYPEPSNTLELTLFVCRTLSAVSQTLALKQNKAINLDAQQLKDCLIAYLF
eukprot:1006887-Pelagomonas_calceolata.AAC.7